MTLDEAIKHCEEVAENVMHENAECAAEHRQLAEWLRELKELREDYEYTKEQAWKRYSKLKERQDIYDRMKECIQDYDEERAHIRADDILCEVLVELVKCLMLLINGIHKEG